MPTLTEPTGTRRHTRAGFSMVELLITLVLVAILGSAASSMLKSQLRGFSRVNDRQEARSVARTALRTLETELAMVDATSGGTNGVIAASSDSISVRVPYASGVFCASGTMLQLPVDSAVLATAVFGGFAIKDTSATGAYTYTNSANSPSAGTSSNCTGVGLTAPSGGSYLAVSSASGSAGAPMFLYQIVTYRLGNSALFAGLKGLYRKVGSGTAQEIAAPFGTSATFRYYTAMSDTALTTTPSVSTIRGVQLKAAAYSPHRTAGRATPELVTVTSAFFFRNRTD